MPTSTLGTLQAKEKQEWRLRKKELLSYLKTRASSSKATKSDIAAHQKESSQREGSVFDQGEKKKKSE